MNTSVEIVFEHYKFTVVRKLRILQSHWSLPLLENRPKKFDFVHQVISCQEVHVS